MIPLQKKELLIQKLQAGLDLTNACKTAGVSKASLYRLFKEQPGLKTLIDQTIAATKNQVQEDHMARLKKIIVKRK